MKGKMHAYSCDTKDRYAVHIYLIIISIGLAFAIQFIVNALNREIPWWLSIPGIFSIYGSIYYVFANFFWKCTFFRVIFFIKTPIVAGAYSGILRSSHDEFVTDKKIDIEILQSWGKILISLKTESSQSFSHTCSIAVEDHPIPTISYLYLNEPSVASVKSMEIHYGMCMLDFNGKDLKGEFFTGRGRQTYGIIEANKIR
ncbi:MAG: hypothetical protein R6X28_13485 [Bacteroidales bacterium]